MSPLLRRARRYPTFLSLAALAILPRLALAGADRFTPFGPGEGYLTRLTAAPSGDLYVTAGFGSSEIWKRKAGASSWTWASRGLERQDVTALAVHPKIPSALWAAAAPASGGFVSIYRSTDAAATWRRVFTGDIDFQVVLLSVVPASTGSVLLAVTARNGNFDRLLRSANGGASWTEIPGVEPPIAAAPDEPGTVYAWDPAARRIAKSTDGARTFRLTGAIALKPADEILALHATYGRPASVFASFRGSFSAGGLYRSGDGGGHWNRVAFVQSGALDVTSEPGNPRRILALRRDGISASDQAGRGGTFRPLVFFSPAEIAADPFSLAAVLGGPYLSAGGDLFRPVSSSRSERVSERGIEAFGVSALAFHPLDPSHVALETFHGCIRDFCDWRTDLSVDGGATWTRLGLQNAPADFIDARAFAFDPASVARFAAILGGHVVLWQPAGGGDVLSASVTSLAFADGGALLAGGRIGIVRSTDSGATWQTTLEPAIPPTPEHPAGGERNVVRLQASPYDPDRLFAFAFDYAQHNPRLPPGNPAIYRTADGGLTWSKLLDGTGDVEFVPGAPSSLYFLTGTELLRSDDDGAIFVVLHTFPLAQRVSGFAIDPAAPQDLYAASASGLLRSRDGGETWAPAPSAIAPWGVFRRALGKVWVDPAERGHVFAAPAAGGLFEERLSN